MENPKIITAALPKKSTTTNARRQPAFRSVSLKHTPSPLRQSVSHSSDESDEPQRQSANDESAPTDSPSSLQPLGGRGSSGESSNAERWFEKSNNEVKDSAATFTDDPPFFLRNSSSSETPPEALQSSRNVSDDVRQTDSLHVRAGRLHLDTDVSSTEDFRGVIDDLTVQNKKLKRKLRKYEELHDAHLKDQKLFEVRIHGLPAEKKRELEETLRKFASSLDMTEANAFPSNGYAGLLPRLKSKPASSQNSNQNGDSAYASMSGQGSSAQSGSDVKQSITPTQCMATRRQNVNSYLHQIPEGLLPQQNSSTMTERAKRKLVVRRVEQLFVGKGAAAGEHHHSLQQQEVSHSAARADRSANEAAGQGSRQEGSREAHIMERETEDPLDLKNGKSKESADGGVAEEQSDQPTQKGGSVPETAPQLATDQRPTRPLDLDPSRAQVPEDNIRYMRHLGFSPPDPHSSRSPVDGHGWIYLNFLVNMAQLHTINVTSDFVRGAIVDHSQKLEVSDDGRKVRWKGGRSVTQTSSSGEVSSNDRPSDSTPDEQSPRKRVKLSHHPSGSSRLTPGQSGTTASQRRQTSTSSKHAYTPMFFQQDDTDSDDSSSEGESDSATSPLLPSNQVAKSSVLTSSGIRTTSGVAAPPSKRKKTRQNDGPIIFYNNARFCTDLSGDRHPKNRQTHPLYAPASAMPIGTGRKCPNAYFEKRGPLAQASELPEAMDLGDNPIPESEELFFPPQSPLEADSPEHDPAINLEVTGIGGVWPVDNFSIAVDSRHARTEESKALNVPADIVTKPLPPRFQKLLQTTENKPQARPAVHKQVLNSKFRELPPSELPPALSYMGFGEEESMSDDDSEEDDDNASEPGETRGRLPPSAAPQPVDFPAFSNGDADGEYDEEDDDDDNIDMESDGEVDFLAAARQIDPDAILKQEREYDANMAERLAEEIPAGSSAATAGGGSGFASPMDGMDLAEHRRLSREHRARAALERQGTTDSMEVQGVQDVSSRGSKDEAMSDASS